MSENGEIYTAGKNFTVPLALTAWTNSTFGHWLVRSTRGSEVEQKLDWWYPSNWIYITKDGWVTYFEEISLSRVEGNRETRMGNWVRWWSYLNSFYGIELVPSVTRHERKTESQPSAAFILLPTYKFSTFWYTKHRRTSFKFWKLASKMESLVLASHHFAAFKGIKSCHIHKKLPPDSFSHA